MKTKLVVVWLATSVLGVSLLGFSVFVWLLAAGAVLFSCAGAVSVFCLGAFCYFLCSRTVSVIVLTDLGVAGLLLWCCFSIEFN